MVPVTFGFLLRADRCGAQQRSQSAPHLLASKRSPACARRFSRQALIGRLPCCPPRCGPRPKRHGHKSRPAQSAPAANTPPGVPSAIRVRARRCARGTDSARSPSLARPIIRPSMRGCQPGDALRELLGARRILFTRPLDQHPAAACFLVRDIQFAQFLASLPQARLVARREIPHETAAQQAQLSRSSPVPAGRSGPPAPSTLLDALHLLPLFQFASGGQPGNISRRARSPRRVIRVRCDAPPSHPDRLCPASSPAPAGVVRMPDDGYRPYPRRP